MYFDRRLFALTRGARGLIALAAVIGLAAVPIGIWQLVLTGQVLAAVVAGAPLANQPTASRRPSASRT